MEILDVHSHRLLQAFVLAIPWSERFATGPKYL